MMVNSAIQTSKITQEPVELDPRVRDERSIEPVEEGEEVAVDTSQPERKMKIGSNLPPEDKEELVSVLRDNQDAFAWAHSDMIGIDPHIICHALNVDLSYPPYQQKRRVFD